MAQAKRIIWISGAGGFSGRRLTAFLRVLPEPLRLVGFGLRRTAPELLDEYHRVDVTDPSGVHKFISTQPPPDRLIHLAGLRPPASEAEMWRVNVGGTLNLLHALSKSACHVRVLSIGSAAEYVDFSEDPVREDHPAGGRAVYGRTKWAQSTLALAIGAQFGMKTMVARTFNLIGPGTPRTLVPGALCAQFAKGRHGIKVGNLAPRRDFIDIRDAVAAYWTICEKGKPGNIYNVCSGKTASIRTLIELFRQSSPSLGHVQQEASRSRDDDFNRVCGDNRKLLKLGFRARISLKQSVRDMLASARSQ